MDFLGLTHLTSAILAMIAGAFVIFTKKGTKNHVRLGYTYAAMMMILNATAFLIYDLFGHFGPFHWAALISLATLIAGLLPAFLQRPRHSWLELHYEFMNWSIVGLYAAFWSETFTRFFRFEGFWILVSTATFMTVAVGVYFIRKKKKQILSRFDDIYAEGGQDTLSTEGSVS